MINTIQGSDGKILAIIVKSGYNKEGIHFFTPNDFSQQLAYMHHSAGHVILPHVHNKVERTVMYTKEVLVVKSGKMRCDFYSDDKQYIESSTVSTGDVILLASGGHGFKCLEETELFEIKQGPYSGEGDKTRFKGVDDDEVRGNV